MSGVEWNAIMLSLLQQPQSSKASLVQNPGRGLDFDFPTLTRILLVQQISPFRKPMSGYFKLRQSQERHARAFSLCALPAAVKVC